MTDDRPFIQPYYEEIVALLGVLIGCWTGTWVEHPRLAIDRAEAEELGMSWEDYCRMRHGQDVVDAWKEQGL